MGMVYGNKLMVYDIDEENKYVENNLNEGEIVVLNVQDVDNIFSCFCIYIVFEFFKES